MPFRLREVFRELAAACGVSFLLAVGAQAQPDTRVLLPGGFVYPAIVRPSVPTPASRSCPTCGRLRSGPLVVAEKNLVYHTVNLDRSPGGWAGNLLTVEAGFGKPWSPELVYGLLPEGIEGQGDKADVPRWNPGSPQPGGIRKGGLRRTRLPDASSPVRPASPVPRPAQVVSLPHGDSAKTRLPARAMAGIVDTSSRELDQRGCPNELSVSPSLRLCRAP